jgi:hypothetical protein
MTHLKFAKYGTLPMQINQDFSVYELIEKRSASNIFLTNESHMIHFSRIIERDILLCQLNCSVYVGIQSLSHLIPIIDRYQQIAQVAEGVYVFGVADMTVPQLPSLNLVLLSPDLKLSREWFIVVNHPDYARVLSAREIGASSNEHSERTFKAILTSDRKIVDYVSIALAEYLSSE